MDILEAHLPDIKKQDCYPLPLGKLAIWRARGFFNQCSNHAPQADTFTVGSGNSRPFGLRL